MNDSKDIIELTKAAVSHLAELDDAIDKALAPVKDYTDTFSDVVGPIRALVGFYTLARRRKFKAFLKSYAERVHQQIKPDELVPKLQGYLQNPQNVELIAETVDSAISAQVARCSSILGFFAGEILSGNKDAEYRDFIVINALENLVDQDLDSFVALYEHLPGDARYQHHRLYEMKEDIEKLGLGRFQLELTVEKLKNHHIVGFDVGGLGNVGNAWGAFQFNENSDYFYSLIKKCGL